MQRLRLQPAATRSKVIGPRRIHDGVLVANDGQPMCIRRARSSDISHLTRSHEILAGQPNILLEATSNPKRFSSLLGRFSQVLIVQSNRSVQRHFTGIPFWLALGHTGPAHRSCIRTYCACRTLNTVGSAAVRSTAETQAAAGSVGVFGRRWGVPVRNRSLGLEALPGMV